MKYDSVGWIRITNMKECKSSHGLFQDTTLKNEERYWENLENRMGGSDQDLNHHINVHYKCCSHDCLLCCKVTTRYQVKTNRDSFGVSLPPLNLLPRDLKEGRLSDDWTEPRWMPLSTDGRLVRRCGWCIDVIPLFCNCAVTPLGSSIPVFKCTLHHTGLANSKVTHTFATQDISIYLHLSHKLWATIYKLG